MFPRAPSNDRRGAGREQGGRAHRGINDRGHEVLAAEGSEIERTCWAPVGEAAWSERVLVVRSPMHATQQAAGLEKRLHHAETTLTALTPPRGRGKRQSTDAVTLVEAIDRVLTADRVTGCSAWPGKSRWSRPPKTWAGVEAC